jgi:hypothetical protein
VARGFVGLSTAEIAKECLRAAGISTTGLSASTVVTRALHTTSDFALILGDTVGRSMRQSYEATPSILKQIARSMTMRDFRRVSLLQTSQFDRLERVGESGEFKRGTFSESGETMQIATFGKVFGITRQAIVNDDLNVFADVPRKMGVAAAVFEDQELVNLLVANPAMADGDPCFHANHGNLAGSGGAPADATLTAARLAMRDQADDSGQLVNCTPKFIVVPSEQETAVEKLLAAIYATSVDDVNAWTGKLTVLVEPRLTDAKAWYLAADPATIDGLRFAHLEGEAGPQIETRQGFDVDGIETRIRLDFGCGIVDWRGLYRNAGQ